MYVVRIYFSSDEKYSI